VETGTGHLTKLPEVRSAGFALGRHADACGLRAARWPHDNLDALVNRHGRLHQTFE
jgi:hypothetical protein